MIFKNNLETAKQNVKLGAVLFATVFLFAGCGEKMVANAGNESEANLILDILHSNGLRASKTAPVEADVKTWEINVDEGWFGDSDAAAAAAIQILNDYGLPRQPEPETAAGDSFGIVTDRAERERQRRDLQMQIEGQLYTLPDVIRASVIIAQPTDDILSLEKTPPSASVSLVLKETQPKFSVEAVQTLVSADVPKLKAENVKVIVSQQAVREIPLEKLAAQRRSNQIFAVGGGVLALLTLSLGAVLYLSKRRKETDDDDDVQSLDENVAGNEFERRERRLLNADSEDDEEEYDGR